MDESTPLIDERCRGGRYACRRQHFAPARERK